MKISTMQIDIVDIKVRETIFKKTKEGKLPNEQRVCYSLLFICVQ